MFKKCVECGMCKTSCPVYRVILRESVSPRGFAILAKDEVIDKVYYACTMCMNCKEACPLDLDLGFWKIREKVVNGNLETEAGKVMINNIRLYGNPYGKLKKGEKPKYLYC